MAESGSDEQTITAAQRQPQSRNQHPSHLVVTATGTDATA